MACFAVPVFADDGDNGEFNVDIGVIGDGSDVDIGVHGDDNNVNLDVGSQGSNVNVDVGGQDSSIKVNAHANVSVNTGNPGTGHVFIDGGRISTLGVAGGYGDFQTQMAVAELEKAVITLFEALNQIGYNLDVTAQGLARVMLFINNQNGTFEDVVELVKNHSDEIGGLMTATDAHDGRFIVMGDNTFALWQKVNALEAQNAEQSLQIQELESGITTLWWTLIGAGCLVVLMAIGIAIMWRRVY